MNPTTTAEPWSLTSRATLTEAERDELFGLLGTYFEGVTPGQFSRDLDEKDWVVRVYHGDRLVGFSTLLATTVSHEGDRLLVIYSGDTIVAPDAWGKPSLARAWIAAVNRVRDCHPGLRCFWLLLTSGFRTYRFLPVFWREFFPRRGVATPEPMVRLMQRLAGERYRTWFDASTGRVRFPRPQRLRGPLANVPDGREEHPDVAFFLDRNPGYRDGDELVCITEIADANLTLAGRRIVASVTR